MDPKGATQVVVEDMNYSVLVLNLDFSPYDIWNWQKTMVKLLSSHSVSPIYNDDGSILKHDMLIRDGQGNRYDLPSIVVLKEYVGNQNHPAPYTKMNIFARDMGICQYCGEETNPASRSVDHVIPRAHWNPRRYTFKLSSFENCVTCCRTCNMKKRNRTPQQANMTLVRKPGKITRAQAYKNKLSMLSTTPEQWKPYL
jgi:5-methylcytosine-specific restriction endonuclease McrA